MENASAVFDRLIEACEGLGFSVRPHRDNGKTELTISDDGFAPITAELLADDEAVRFSADLLQKTDEDEEKLALIINEVNDRIAMGGCELGPDDLSVSYRLTSSYRDCVPGQNMFALLLLNAARSIRESRETLASLLELRYAEQGADAESEMRI